MRRRLGRRVVAQVGAVAEYEGAMIALRMARGRRRAVAQGRSIGRVPSFGWRKDPDNRGRLVPDPATFPLVEEATRRRADGATLREVADYLEAGTGRAWHPTQVSRLVERHRGYAAA